MFKNAICIPLCAGALVAVTISGCFFEEDEDCYIEDYCKDNQVWTVADTGEWSDCVEHVGEDCSETGRVCQEYHDGYIRQAGCYYPGISCDANVHARCDGDFVYQCDSTMNAAVRRESCTATGRVCREYTDETGETAGCFYEGTPCEDDDNEDFSPEVCDGDVVFGCNQNTAMASYRKDCGETGELCVALENGEAICTAACTEEGDRKCNDAAVKIVRCEDGAWIPEETCWQNTYCAEVEQAGETEPRCVEGS